MNQWFEQLVEQFTLARNDEAIAETLERMTSEAGFQYFAYLNLQAARQTAISNYNEEWQSRYFENGYASIDPVVLKGRSRVEAFAWSNRETPGMNRKRRTFYGEAAEFGIRSGITIPIKTGFSCVAMLTLASSEADFAEGLYFNPVRAAAAFGQVHVHIDMVSQRSRRSTNYRLKADELTCLRWSAEGKSMKAIAIIENTTYSNVAFFIRNAKEALGVRTLPQATALAKELGLI